MFVLSIFFYSLSYACFSGTDEAVVYDTSRELGEDTHSLRRLGQYSAAEKIFKIVTPLAGALVAKDLMDWQFNILLVVDTLAAILALVISLYIVEPKQYFKVEKVEAGVFRDAVKLIKNNPSMMRAMLNRAFVFTSVFLVWRYHQELFTSIGTPIIALGIGWSLFNFIVTVLNFYIHLLWPKQSLMTKINFLNFLTLFFVVIFLIALYFKVSYYWVLLIYFCVNIAENMRWPIFSDLFNKYSNSYNRATTLSLSNLIKSIFDIPLLFVTSLLVTRGLVYPIYFTLAIIFLSCIFLYLPKKLEFENKF
ncbi:MAG: major facilitator transporter [uncultured bacterium]|nr:MAG: major facilitator transporter [uncultured bacterium]